MKNMKDTPMNRIITRQSSKSSTKGIRILKTSRTLKTNQRITSKKVNLHAVIINRMTDQYVKHRSK
jgi:hypothetical protein